jgi:hypothetical protein
LVASAVNPSSLKLQGNRISELRHEPDEVGLIPVGSFELAAQRAF